MRVAVIGAGIVGVTTAYELARDGHEVSVYERHGSVAAEASFANACIVAPGCVIPWSAPLGPGPLLHSLFGRDGPLQWKLPVDRATLAWMWAWSRGRGDDRRALQRLALFSRRCLHEIAERHSMDYERSPGVLLLMRTPRELANAQAMLASFQELGIRHEVLDGPACHAQEPGLRESTPLHAGVHLPDDEVGNCRQFAHLLRSEAQALGVRFHFYAEVERLVAGPRPQFTVRVAAGAESDLSSASTPASRLGFAATAPLPAEPTDERVDAVVVCTAMGSAGLLAPLGFRLPMAAICGYSVTVPLRQLDGHAEHGPRSAVVDHRYRVAISRLGSRIRVAGGMEVGGRPGICDDRAIETLYSVLQDWYPGAAKMTGAQRWKGARPTLPDGAPVLGESGLPGIWLNLAHGAHGWALASGCARVIADRISSRASPVDVGGFSVERLHR